MDFIVLGTIFGATMMVVGTVLRDLVPRRLRVADDDTPWVGVRDRRRTVRASLVGGRLATLAGVTILLTTLALVLIDPSDPVALTLVIGLSVAAVAVSVGWVVWYRYQESTGAIQRRQLRAITERLGRADGSTPSSQVARPRDPGRTGSQQQRSGRGRPVMAGSDQVATPGGKAPHEDRDPRDREPGGVVVSRRAAEAGPRGKPRPRIDAPHRMSGRPVIATGLTDPQPVGPERQAHRGTPEPPDRRGTGGRGGESNRPPG